MTTHITEIEKCRLSNTEEKIILSIKKYKIMDFNNIVERLNILIPTISNALSSLLYKDLIVVINNKYQLTNKGYDMINYLNFKKATIIKFSTQNKMNINSILQNKSNYSLSLIVAIYNTLKKSY